MDPTCAQSVSAPPPGQPPQHYHPQRQHATPHDAPLSARSSPFASGPVAMVNQIRPGFGPPGQFPGVAVRTAPTQLSTPLQLQRRSSAPQDSRQMADTAYNRNPLFPPASTATTPQLPSDQGLNASMQHQPPYGVPSDIFGDASQPSPFQVQAVNEPTPDLFPRVERASAESLFGAPAAPTPPGRLTQRSSYDSLFGGTTSPSTPIGNTNVVRSSQSFSYGQTTAQAMQQREEYPPRSFGAPPPPAAPFLGYAEPSRSQSVRAASNGSLDSRVTAAFPTQPRLAPRSSSGTLPVTTTTTTPLRINVEVRSADDLLEEFMRLSVNEHGHGNHVALPPSKLMLADIPDKISSLESLYKQKRWKTLTKKSLSMLQNPSNTPRVTLEIKSWWLAGLIKDGHYDNATSVLDQIGDLDDPQYSSMGDDSEDAFVLIRLRLLEALLSKCKGNLAEHEKKLFQLISKIRNALSGLKTIELLGVHEPTASKWLRIGQFTLVNHLLHQQKYALALRVCSTIEIDGLTENEKIVMVSRLGRVHLQMGDLQIAEKLFSLARSQLERMPHSAGHLDARMLLNDGLLLFAQNKLQEALSAFDSVLHLEDASCINEHPVELGGSCSDEQLFLEEDLICSAVNNYAICALYCCDVKGAVAALERMIRINPARFLNAVVVFNLSSLYDLMFDNPTSTNRKEMMKKIAEMYDLEHIDPAAFRI